MDQEEVGQTSLVIKEEEVANKLHCQIRGSGKGAALLNKSKWGK